MNSNPFTLERIYDIPSETIWRAITDKDQMKHWYFDLAEFRPEVGFEFQFYGGPEDGKQYHHICVITEVIVGQKLRYSWRYEGYEGMSYVTFELFPEANRTRLKLIHEGLETFPSNNPDFAKTNFAEGWTAILGSGLKNYLEKK